MQVFNFAIEAYLEFEGTEIDQFLTLCENAIQNTTHNQNSVFKLKSALHELVVNSLEHGYDKKGGLVCFKLSKKENQVSLEVSDFGKGIQLSPFEQNPITIEEADPRGWGLMIIHRLADSVFVEPNHPIGSKIIMTISE